jgi:V/A-type H+-transporting ATPase subunit I
VRAHGAASSPPVQLNNPGPVKSFETLLALLPLPKYGSIDPTWFMATFFPPIFGLMLADIGYGLLLVLGTLWLWRLGRRVKMAQALAVILGSCAFFTIVFGVIFGEFFGTAGHHLGLRPLWRERLEIGSDRIGQTLLMYLGMAVAVGVVHILCGLVLGIINAVKSRHAAEGLGAVARIFGLFGMFFVVGRLADVLPPVFTSLGVLAWILFLVFMLWTFKRHPLHGAMLPLELLGTVGNILSYARIMAVGLASAVLALLANKFGTMIDNVVLAVIVVVLVHALNLVLGVVDPSIQGLRLHYVEFFSKFYLSGGRMYSPFKKMGDQLS